MPGIIAVCDGKYHGRITGLGPRGLRLEAGVWAPRATYRLLEALFAASFAALFPRGGNDPVGLDGSAKPPSVLLVPVALRPRLGRARAGDLQKRRYTNVASLATLV